MREHSNVNVSARHVLILKARANGVSIKKTLNQLRKILVGGVKTRLPESVCK